MGKEKKWIFLDHFSGEVSKITGSTVTFLCVFVVIVIWAFAGPYFNFSNTWRQVMDTGIPIVTFLMVFVIHQVQNKETLSLQMKLNELIAATKGASNRVLNIEEMTEEELQALKKFYAKLSDLSAIDGNFGATHSIDEAKKNEGFKEAQ